MKINALIFAVFTFGSGLCFQQAHGFEGIQKLKESMTEASERLRKAEPKQSMDADAPFEKNGVFEAAHDEDTESDELDDETE